MSDFNAQGKDHKVAATQETITAQNSTNQGKEMFNAISEKELLKVLDNFDFGLVQPSYIITNLRMSERLIDKARMNEDQKAVLRNAFGFLLIALKTASKELTRGPWEHIAEEFYPDDLETALDDPDEDADYLLEQGLNEIGYILSDFMSDDGEYTEGSWDEAKDVIDEYIRILSEHDYEIPEYIYNDMKEIESKWA